MDAWWKAAIGYQIWPASFKDSNNDGVGDIQGIVDKLGYLQSLDVSLIWLSPVYDSPQVDMGYDVSDYEKIYAKYGTVGDMERLINEAHQRGFRIVMDLVVNHTSDQHKWFLESRRSRTGPFSDWYIWRDAKYDGQGRRLPPNNWRTGSRHGKSTWTYVAERDQYYFNFGGPYQPNLNWLNADVRAGIYASAIEFWLRRGIDGFRMDLVGFYWKDPEFPDAEVVYPEEHLQPLDGRYCQNGREVHAWLRDIKKKVTADYGEDIVLIGELPGTDGEDFLSYIQPQSQELHMALDTDIFIVGNNWIDGLHELKRPELPLLKDAVLKTQSLLDTGGWPTVFLENHDFARSVSRFGPGDGPHREAAARMLALMACTLSGTLFIYQGEEIGMTNIPPTWTKDDFRDVPDLDRIEDMMPDVNRSAEQRKLSEDAAAALVQWGRDNGRTPVQWSEDTHAGFSGTTPWIRVNDNYREINVAQQSGRADSVLSFWKRMVALRKNWARVLVHGNFRLIDRNDKRTFAYVKTDRDSDVQTQVLVILNFSEDVADVALPGFVGSTPWDLVLSTWTSPALHEAGSGRARLQEWEGRLYQSVEIGSP